MMEEKFKKVERTDLIYPELSYEIISVLFEVFNEIGFGYQEKYYQRAIAHLFGKRGLRFRQQVPVGVYSQGKKMGGYFLDFLIKDEIILEIKQGNIFRRSNIQQVFAYLRATKKKLGIIANFTRNGVIFKRIVNL